jgi:hypothetical protein
MSASSAAKEALWLCKLLCDYFCDIDCVLMLADNQGAIHVTKHPIANYRTKRIDAMHHFVRERVARGEIALIAVYSCTTDGGGRSDQDFAEALVRM